MNMPCFNLRLRSAKVKIEKIFTFFHFYLHMSFFCCIFVSEINEIMNYKIYQLDIDNINVLSDHRLFESWDMLNRTCGFSKHCYKKVYEGEVAANTIVGALDSLFQKFNLNHPEDFHGHSLSVSDVVELDGVWYYCDSIGWVNIKTEEKL